MFNFAKKNDVVFKSADSLQQVVNIVNEAAAAINDTKLTISKSAIRRFLPGLLAQALAVLALLLHFMVLVSLVCLPPALLPG